METTRLYVHTFVLNGQHWPLRECAVGTAQALHKRECVKGSAQVGLDCASGTTWYAERDCVRKAGVCKWGVRKREREQAYETAHWQEQQINEQTAEALRRSPTL